MFETLEASLKTNKVNIISEKEVTIKGNKRQIIQAKKSNGKRIYHVVQYENGMFSSAV